MDDHLAALSAIPGLSPKDAVIGRALIRNDLLPADVVIAAASHIAAASEEGLLERLTYDGHLDSLRAAQIERALEKKLEQRKAEASSDESSPESRDRFTTPTGRRPRMWKPKGKYYTGESSVVLLNELRDRHGPEVEELESKLAASEAARTELESRLDEMAEVADEAEIHKASLEAMKAMMETVQTEAERAKEQSSFKEDFIEQLMQELQSEDSRRRELERENQELKNSLTPAKGSPSPVKKTKKAKKAKTKRTTAKKKPKTRTST